MKRCPEKRIAKGLNPTAATTWHGRATRHSQPVPYHWPAGRARSVGARPCAFDARPCFARFHALPCSLCPGLPRTSTLILNPPKMRSLQIKPEGSP